MATVAARDGDNVPQPWPGRSTHRYVPLPNLLIRQFLLDPLVYRHLVSLRREPGLLHPLHDPPLLLPPLPRQRRLADQVVPLFWVVLQVVQLGHVLVGRAVAGRVVDVLPVFRPYGPHVW